MKKKDVHNVMRLYEPEKLNSLFYVDADGTVMYEHFTCYGSPHDTEPNLQCDCGSFDFKVCWWDYDYTGGYLRVKCSKCGEELVIIDDYA